MKSRKGILVLAVPILLGILVFFNRDRVHFDWGVFWSQVRHIRWGHIVAGVALIYSTFWLRSIRWSVFLSATKRIPTFSLVGAQFIGFTAVALFGRLADVIRPALVARRVELPLASQLAVYTIERMFDLGAAAIIFSGALLFVPRDLPHHEIFVRTGAFSFALTASVAIFAVIIRTAGGAVASIVESSLGRLSKPMGTTVATKIRGFRDGLNAISSAQDFLVTALISLAIWVCIGFAYVETLHAFADTPELATVSFSRTMLLMGTSIGASLLQVPIIGWFTQIAATAAAMHGFYNAPIEAATACGAMLLFVTFLSIIPAGLICARVGGVSLRAVPAAAEANSAEAITSDVS